MNENARNIPWGNVFKLQLQNYSLLPKSIAYILLSTKTQLTAARGDIGYKNILFN
jgi:hypothetical protein